MNYEPFALTNREIREIAALPEVQQKWGAANADEMQQILNRVYTARFVFISAPPGHVSDTYLIQSDTPNATIPATRLSRVGPKELILLK